MHEQSASHVENYVKWETPAQNTIAQNTIESQLSKQFEEEKQRLRKVFKRLIAFTLYLARRNLASTWSNVHDPEGRNRNFQQLIHTCAEFDPLLKEHLEKQDKVHYMSAKTQNDHQNNWIESSNPNFEIRQTKQILRIGPTNIAHTEQMWIFVGRT